MVAVRDRALGLHRAARLRPHVEAGRTPDARRPRRPRAQPGERARLLHGGGVGRSGPRSVRGRLARRQRRTAADRSSVHDRAWRRGLEPGRRTHDPTRSHQAARAQTRQHGPHQGPAEAARLPRGHAVERGHHHRAGSAGDLSAGAGGRTPYRCQQHRPAADGTLDRVTGLTHILRPPHPRHGPHAAHAGEHARQRRRLSGARHSARAAGHVCGPHLAGLRHGHRLDPHIVRRHVSRAAGGLRHRAHAAHDRKPHRPDRFPRACWGGRGGDRRCRHTLRARTGPRRLRNGGGNAAADAARDVIIPEEPTCPIRSAFAWEAMVRPRPASAAP